jgi:hypothetical protein
LLILIGYLTSSCANKLWQLYLLYSILATVGENSISSFTTAAILSPGSHATAAGCWAWPIPAIL